MKMIIAYIRHDAFEPIRDALLEKGLPSLSADDVKGTGRQPGVTERYRGSSVTNYLRPKVRLEVGVGDDDVQTVVDTILTHATTGGAGDGKIFVRDVEQVIRIRTGETGEVTMQKHDTEGVASAD